VFEPARALGVLAVPLSWLARGEVRAAEEALLGTEGARRAAGRAVLVAAQSRAAPVEEALASGRGLVHAEVYEHVREVPDRVRVRYAPGSRVEPGMPVVCGDFYVGRVVTVARPSSSANASDPAAVSREPGEAIVELVTDKDFRVGGEIEAPVREEGAGPGPVEGPPRLIVGGVVPRGRAGEKGARDLLLAVHSPSDRKVIGGSVRVRETDLRGPLGPTAPRGPGERRGTSASGDEAYAHLADGFLLGTLETIEREGQRFPGIRPGLDYSGGLYQLTIVSPSANPSAGVDLARDPFDDAAWIDVSVALPGDPTAWREGRIVRAGRSRAVEDGAALAIGATFLGTIVRAGRSSSTASLLGDAGLEVSALASPVAPEAFGDPAAPPIGPPIAIGRLLSLGRDRSTGEVILRWDAALPLPEEPNARGVAAVLYTAAGQRSVPPGLRIGWTVLPRGRGPFALRVRQEIDGIAVVRMRAWRDPARASFDAADPTGEERL
jgi:hypothetical protein